MKIVPSKADRRNAFIHQEIQSANVPLRASWELSRNSCSALSALHRWMVASSEKYKGKDRKASKAKDLKG